MEKIKELYETTELTIEEISRQVNIPMWKTFDFIAKNYSKEVRNARKKKCYATSKQGNKNPMFGKFAAEHHNYIGEVSDGKGYLMVLKPDWYTGRKGCKHVFVHHVVICESLGLTEIPSGFCVHHIDGNRTNNKLNNLALLTTSAHTRLHQLEGATTSRKA